MVIVVLSNPIRKRWEERTPLWRGLGAALDIVAAGGETRCQLGKLGDAIQCGIVDKERNFSWRVQHAQGPAMHLGQREAVIGRASGLPVGRAEIRTVPVLGARIVPLTGVWP